MTDCTHIKTQTYYTLLLCNQLHNYMKGRAQSLKESTDMSLLSRVQKIYEYYPQRLGLRPSEIFSQAQA